MKLWQAVVGYIVLGIITIAITIGGYALLAYVIVKVVKAAW